MLLAAYSIFLWHSHVRFQQLKVIVLLLLECSISYQIKVPSFKNYYLNASRLHQLIDYDFSLIGAGVHLFICMITHLTTEETIFFVAFLLECHSGILCFWWAGFLFFVWSLLLFFVDILVRPATVVSLCYLDFNCVVFSLSQLLNTYESYWRPRFESCHIDVSASVLGLKMK